MHDMNNNMPLSYAAETCTTPLIGHTIGRMFDDIVNRYPNKEAIVVPFQDVRFSYVEFKQEVDRVAKAFIKAGLKKGERIGIWAPNRIEWTLTQYASAKVGAILVNINPSYRLHELEYVLNQSECHFLVAADTHKYSNYTSMLQELAPELEHSTPGRLNASRVPELRSIITLRDQTVPGMMKWNEFMSLADSCSDEELALRASELSCDDPINIQYTSGTTGFPKGATLSHHNILNNALITGDILGYTSKTRVVVPVPLYHCFGMVLGNLGAMTHGATVIYPGESFDPQAVLKTVHDERGTSLYGVPTMFIAYLNVADFESYDLSSLRTGIMAGAPCPIEVMKQVKSRMHIKDIQIAYGMTETSPVSTQTRIGTPTELQVSTVGQVHPWQEIKIVDPATGLTLPLGETGEVCMRGYAVMLGYWNNEKRTRETIDDARWIHSGDLGTMDENGYIRIVGRMKDMIIRGGENIYPREIEEFLHSHPKIDNVQVIGVPDEKYGEEVMAWIKLEKGATLTEEEIKAFCKDKIAYYKIPRHYKFVDSFPMTVTGKIRKVEMRKISTRELTVES